MNYLNSPLSVPLTWNVTGIRSKGLSPCEEYQACRLWNRAFLLVIKWLSGMWLVSCSRRGSNMNLLSSFIRLISLITSATDMLPSYWGTNSFRAGWQASSHPAYCFVNCNLLSVGTRIYAGVAKFFCRNSVQKRLISFSSSLAVMFHHGRFLMTCLTSTLLFPRSTNERND